LLKTRKSLLQARNTRMLFSAEGYDRPTATQIETNTTVGHAGGHNQPELLHFHSTAPESEGSIGGIVLIGAKGVALTNVRYATTSKGRFEHCYQALVSAGAMGAEMGAETRAAMNRAASKTKKSAVAKGNHRTRRGRTSRYSD
jgi:hypothetical protein